MSDDSSSAPDPSPFAPPDPSLATGVAPAEVSDPDAPVIIGVSFETKIRGQEFLLAVGGLRQKGALQLKDAVTVTKSMEGDVRVVETIDPTPGRAAFSGAVWTGLIGLLVGGPVGWLAGIGVGAGAGAVTAKVVDLGIPDEWVDWFKEAVAPGRSAVVILADQVDVPALAAEVGRFPGARLLYTTMVPSAVDQLTEATGES
ncbi:MAG: DUF1269 domain-containing protein [Actinomycetota bacterium]